MLKRSLAGLIAAVSAGPAFAAEVAGASGGMPQFDFERVAVSQIFWLFVTFAILYALMLTMLPKVGGVTERRASTIGGDLDAADKARIDAEDRRTAYEANMAKRRVEAQEVIAAAKADAAKSTEVRMAEADKATAATVDAAMADLDRQKGEALTRVEAIAANATQDIVEKLTGSRPDESRAATAVAAAKA